MNILLFGAPGAGKGTQSALLVDKVGMKHVSTGDMFRYNMKNETPLGLEAKKYVDQGNLVPDEITIKMVEQEFLKLEGKSFILDGFPRTVPQAEALKSMLEANSMNLDKAIFLEVGKGILLERLTGRRVCKDCGATYHVEAAPTSKEGVCDKCSGEVIQRKDDSEEAIKTRLEVYEAQTTPVKQYYSDSGQLVELEGTGSTDEVFTRLQELLAAD